MFSLIPVYVAQYNIQEVRSMCHLDDKQQKLVEWKTTIEMKPADAGFTGCIVIPKYDGEGKVFAEIIQDRIV
jgi:hypothetical protein